MARITHKGVFANKVLSLQSVFYYFNKWSKNGCWKKVLIDILSSNRQYLDLSSVESGGVPLDGSHTPAKNGGDAVGYQGRKACNTSNTLFISDNQGIMLAMSTPQESQHHDLFEIQMLFTEICDLLKKAHITLKGLFLNADPSFDGENFYKACENENITPNVKPNPRNELERKRLEPYQRGIYIFDEEL
jgi:hypothetical protein